jgi:hypothetical protein
MADYVPYIPWIEDLLGTFMSFSPVVSQNPNPVSVGPAPAVSGGNPTEIKFPRDFTIILIILPDLIAYSLRFRQKMQGTLLSSFHNVHAC